MKYLAIFLLSCVVAYASDINSFLKNGIGINSISMGQAFYNINDIECAYYNPALLSNCSNLQTKLVSSRTLDTVDELYASVLIPFSFMSFGIIYFNSSIGNGISGATYDQNSDTITNTGKSLNYASSLLLLCASKKINESVQLGLNFKSLTKTIASSSSSLYAIDLGMNFFLIPDCLNLSVKSNNLYSTAYEWTTEQEKPENENIIGLGIHSGAVKLNLGYKAAPNSNQIYSGFEWNHYNTLFCRLGYDQTNFSTGITFRLDGLAFNYCFSHPLETNSILENSHRFGLEYIFL